MPIATTESGWVLETQSTGYAFGFNPAGRLIHSYWGARLPQLGDYPAPSSSAGWASFNGPAQIEPEEYPGYGGLKYIDPCLKVTFADGVRDLLLQLDSAQVDDGAAELQIHLRDATYPFHVTLHYRVHADYDLIERWVTVTNHGDTPIAIERIWSAQWHMPLGDQYRLRSAQAHPFSAVQYVSKDRGAGVLFAFRTHLPDPISLPSIRLRGLDPQTRYQVEGFPGARSGLALMEAGLHIQLHDFESTVRRIQRVDLEPCLHDVCSD